MFKNEGPYLKEWLEFHMLVGVEHFYLYNNLSTDNYYAVLEPYVKKGIVDLIDWPYSTPGNWTSVQLRAFTDGIKRAQGQAKWLAVLDLDEFLFAVQEDNVAHFLTDYENYGGVCANWQFFGTSHVQKIPLDKLMIETLTLKADTNYQANRQVKSIVRPERVARVIHPHFFIYKPPFFQVNANKQRFQGSMTYRVDIDKLRINHYWTGDEEHFHKTKLNTRLRFGTSRGFIINRYRQLNSMHDSTILRFVPYLREKIYGAA